jgi:hypothetical protein
VRPYYTPVSAEYLSARRPSVCQRTGGLKPGWFRSQDRFTVKIATIFILDKLDGTSDPIPNIPITRNQAMACVQLLTYLPRQTMPVERNRGTFDQRVNDRGDIDGFDPMKAGELPGPRLMCK